MPRTFVIIQSPPGSEAAREGKRLAREFAADLLLRVEGAALAREEALEGFCGTVFVAREDLDTLGVRDAELDRVVKVVTREELERLAAEGGEILNTF
jgi:sulfur relay (sulfurtransferase) DsrF/TusC family protein